MGKAQSATLLIADGAAGSSTDKYRQAVTDLANSSSYSPTDVVMVSVNGRRNARVRAVDSSGELIGKYRLLQRAVDAGATIIGDAASDRPGPWNYNIGTCGITLNNFSFFSFSKCSRVVHHALSTP